MSFLKKLFGSSSKEKNATLEYSDKKDFKVYPRIKNSEWDALSMVYHIPLAGDLVLVFVQDINDRISYVTDEDIQKEEIRQQVNLWKENIRGVDFELFSPDSWKNRVYFNHPGDYSNEKIFDSGFIRKACELLNTEKLIISISRRHRMQITAYNEDFLLLEDFFFSHFAIWGDANLDDETISEMILIAEKDRITHVVPLGFRMNLYEKEGKKVLNYSTMEDLGDKIDFQQIIENKKIALNPKIFKY